MLREVGVDRARHGAAERRREPDAGRQRRCQTSATRAPARHVARAIARAGQLAQSRETTGPSRACALQRASRRAAVVVGIGHRAFDPRFAILEELVFPDRRDLLHALDRVRGRPETPRRGGPRPRRSRRWPRRRSAARRGDGWRAMAPGQCSAASCAICSKTLIASGSYASYSRYADPRPCACARTTPRNGTERAAALATIASLVFERSDQPFHGERCLADGEARRHLVEYKRLATTHFGFHDRRAGPSSHQSSAREVLERAATSSQARRLGDCPGHIGLGAPHGIWKRVAQGQPRGDRRRERASGAVRVRVRGRVATRARSSRDRRTGRRRRVQFADARP